MALLCQEKTHQIERNYLPKDLITLKMNATAGQDNIMEASSIHHWGQLFKLKDLKNDSQEPVIIRTTKTEIEAVTHCFKVTRNLIAHSPGSM